MAEPSKVGKRAALETYTPERRAEFLLSNAVKAEDYRRAVEAVRAMGLDPERIPHHPPAAKSVGTDIVTSMPTASSPPAGATHLLTGDVRHFGPYYGRTVGGARILAPGDYLRERRG